MAHSLAESVVFDLGFERAGFRTVWQVEKEPFCIAVLKTHWPNAERYYDILRCGHDRIHKLSAVDVVTAGFPCQDLSVAGKRAGLAGTRSGLFWEVIRIVGELRPPWLVLENVPGLFSSNEGRDFAIVLRELGQLGCFQSIAWTVLDSRYFGVAQRRRRVFIVCGAVIGSAEQVLFESESGPRDSAEGGEAWERTANTLTDGTGRVGSRGCDDGANIVRQAISSKWAKGSSGPAGDEHHNLVAAALSASAGHHGHSSPRGDGTDNLVATINSGGNSGGFRTEPGEHLIAVQDVRGRRDKKQNSIGIDESGGPLYTLDGTSQHAVAFALREDPGGIGHGWNTNYAISPPLTRSIAKNFAGSGSGNDGVGTAVISTPTNSNGVRDFAELPEGLDSARYRTLGNAVTVNTAQWLAERIKQVMACSPVIA